MKILDIEQNSTEWLEARKGKITGSKLKDIVISRGTKQKIGFYQLIADRLSIDEEKEDPMERGHRLEEEAVRLFSDETGKIVSKCGMWISDEDNNIACSPDGVIKKGKNITEAVEVKCLSASRHLEAWFTKEIPNEYEYQVLQYFIVNEKLEKLYFCFFDPRVTSKPFFYLEVNREDKKDDIQYYLTYQKETLSKINQLIEELTF